MAETDMSKLYENLPDNSHASRNDKRQLENMANGATSEKRVEKVVHGKVKAKKNELRTWTDMFISEDVANVKNYIIMDVIIPSVKKAFYDVIVGALDMSLYGGRGNGKRPTADKVSYINYNDPSRREERTRHSTRTASGYSYDDITVETRGEAETVLTRMDEIMEAYEQVRVADLYDLVGITGDYTDNKYGWTNMRNARIVRTRDGYKIEMPRAIQLK
jgi:hypothetical protein